MQGLCELCERDEVLLTKHHLLPREEGGTEEHVVLLCPDCHKQIHALYTNKELALRLDHINKLKEDEQLVRYLKFIRKQPSTRQMRIKKSTSRKAKRR